LPQSHLLILVRNGKGRKKKEGKKRKESRKEGREGGRGMRKERKGEVMERR
jgi:hypothetical protein